MNPDVIASTSSERYWVEKLRRLLSGTSELPAAVSSGEDGAGIVEVQFPGTNSAITLGIEEVILGALCISLVQFGASSQLVIATPWGPIEIIVIDLEPGTLFLDRLHEEILQTQQAGPLDIDSARQYLGSDEEALERLWSIQLDCGANVVQVPGAQLRVSLDVMHDSIRLRFSFERSQYPEWFISHLGQCICLVARQLLRSGEDGSELRFVSSEEQRRIIEDFNNTADVGIPTATTLHGLVEFRASLVPAAIALIYKGRPISYQELDVRATNIASHLLDVMGILPGHRVGIFLPRSDLAIIAILGVLKAGAAYVPIDPGTPWQRTRYMTEDVAALIVDSSSVASAAAYGGRLLIIDAEMNFESCLPGRPLPSVTAATTAYVIYTSGSTGRPKGVEIAHHAIVNTVCWRIGYYALDQQDVSLQLPSLSFDSSVIDIFCMLVAGGRIVIPLEERRLDTEYLAAAVQTYGVTTFVVTPSYYRRFLRELDGKATMIRTVTVAGEALGRDLIATHADVLPTARLTNEYGPTENAVCSTAGPVHTTDEYVSIGRPIANVEVFVLDRRQRVCPVGAPGEIYLGGRGLSRGYLGEPNLSKESFMPNPIPERAANMVYRTGDRARWRPDGQLEFLGRLDDQVKVRGVRVEISEVEEAIAKYPAVQSVAVVARQDWRGETFLLAYVVLHGERSPYNLRGFLRRLLTASTVPEHFEIVNALPLTVSGKIDRARLRAEPINQPSIGMATAMTSEEARIQGIVSEVLGRSGIGLDENLFDAGIHSLRVMELFAKLRDEISGAIRLMDIYTFPTVRALARTLWDGRKTSHG